MIKTGKLLAALAIASAARIGETISRNAIVALDAHVAVLMRASLAGAMTETPSRQLQPDSLLDVSNAHVTQRRL